MVEIININNKIANRDSVSTKEQVKERMCSIIDSLEGDIVKQFMFIASDGEKIQLGYKTGNILEAIGLVETIKNDLAS